MLGTHLIVILEYQTMPKSLVYILAHVLVMLHYVLQDFITQVQQI